MDRAVAIAVVADGTVEEMITQNAVECFSLRSIRGGRIRDHVHSCKNGCRARSNKVAVNFDHTGITRLYWAKLWVVAHLRYLAAATIDDIDEALINLCVLHQTVNRDTEHSCLSLPTSDIYRECGGSLGKFIFQVFCWFARKDAFLLLVVLWRGFEDAEQIVESRNENERARAQCHRQETERLRRAAADWIVISGSTR